MREEDRRKFIRLKAYHLAKFKSLNSLGDKGANIAVTVKDIGGGGVCFLTDEYLPVSSLIELKINFPHVSTAIFSLAKIVWIKQIKKTRRYEAGAQFVEIDESVRRVIEEQVKSVYNRLNKRRGLFKNLLFRLKGRGKK